MVKRGDIVFVNLDPTVGSEIQKTRPCMVVSPPEMHDFLRTVLVAPMTTKGRPAPYRVQDTGGERGLILLDQLRAVDKSRVGNKIGTASPKVLAKVLTTLREVFAD